MLASDSLGVWRAAIIVDLFISGQRELKYELVQKIR
jgi:hypothetical protein